MAFHGNRSRSNRSGEFERQTSHRASSAHPRPEPLQGSEQTFDRPSGERRITVEPHASTVESRHGGEKAERGAGFVTIDRTRSSSSYEPSRFDGPTFRRGPNRVSDSSETCRGRSRVVRDQRAQHPEPTTAVSPQDECTMGVALRRGSFHDPRQDPRDHPALAQAPPTGSSGGRNRAWRIPPSPRGNAPPTSATTSSRTIAASVGPIPVTPTPSAPLRRNSVRAER